MKRKRASRRADDLCAQRGEDDGVDPKQFFAREGIHGKVDSKARRLCGQIADTLSLVLSGECDDPVLQALQVVSVEPAPDSSQYLILVAPAAASDVLEPCLVRERLARASGLLRSAVAASITRRRAPRLMFRFISDPGDGRSDA